jgi:hypothetical protein
MTTELQDARILIPAQGEEDHAEGIWVKVHPTQPNLYQINNIPFGRCGIAFHDWVECTPRTEESLPVFQRVHEHSGNGTMGARLKQKLHWVHIPWQFRHEWKDFVREMERLEWPAEGIVKHMLTVAVPDDPKAIAAANALLIKFPRIELGWILKPVSLR